MKVAYLILCHNDEEHISRLVKKITEFEFFDVYIHVDLKVDISNFKQKVGDNKSVTFVEERYEVSWGGYSAVKATMSLINSANQRYDYDRYVLLQGLDYPLKTNKEIYNFFMENKNKEFIRGCNISKSTDKYFYSRCKYYLFYEKINPIKKVINKLNYMVDLKVRSGYIKDGRIFDVYWGSAQWALTSECIKYIIKFHNENKKFNRYFKHSFPVDELYFTTIVFNSKFSTSTSMGGPENEKRGLVNWRNIHYFEYPKNIKIFSEYDFQTLMERDELFCRKVNSIISRDLLEKIDKVHQNKNDNYF
ncbi:beta-1,6-N-acetylglucosaminyltransferase [Robertmurraya korlensis]|uniref:beta-1,6-N-acetylglucosaminyltransferase n=1 Tax=Robertmurraya korlensis TaxID=519977 RepID=UPI0020417564|nr:beta-1,6-N-acetylglucosaminyltransferase [Robertmurraya korlensis]MCM3602198.1 beta-1,6-N-acetylglucosaminyltransferase [Robertmurraya korlensis]